MYGAKKRWGCCCDVAAFVAERRVAVIVKMDNKLHFTAGGFRFSMEEEINPK